MLVAEAFADPVGLYGPFVDTAAELMKLQSKTAKFAGELGFFVSV